MPNIIFKVKNYKNEDAIENLVRYIITSPYFDICGYKGCFLYPKQDTAEGIANSFRAVKNVHYKNNGQLVQHIIIGFAESDCITGQEVCQIGDLLSCGFYMSGYQNFWGVHFGGDNSDRYWHIHMAVNTVNALTGLRYIPSNENRQKVKVFLERYYPRLRWRDMETESFFHEN